MSKKANPAIIGAFVIVSLALAVGAIAIWGSSSLFERKHEYVCYFPGSVSGLTRGAAVKYRGVEIGVVKQVRIRFRQAPDDRRIPAIIELWGKRTQELAGHEPTPESMEELVSRGLRARLASTSLVTGVMYVNLDEAPGTPIHRSELPGPGALPEIPTLSAEFDELTASLNQLLSNLRAADVKGMSDAVSVAMQAVARLASSDGLRTSLDALPGAISSAHRLTRTLDADAAKAGDLVEDGQAAVAALRDTLAEAHGIVSPDAPLPVDLGAAVSDVDKAAIAVRELADFLRRNPHALVAGTKPRRANQ
jgi:paraquat-inducible protein B